MSQKPILPLDVVHIILRMFRLPEDATTLGSCSRACKSWLPVARKYLFADLVVAHPVPPNYAHNLPNHQEWHGVLKPVKADVAVARRLEVISDQGPPVLEVLYRIVPSLPLVQHIRLRGGRLFSLLPLSDAPLRPSPAGSLELFHALCSARAFMHLLKVIRPRHLSIIGVYLAFMLDGDRENGDLPAEAFDVATSVRSLRLASSYPSVARSADDFMSLCAPKTIRHLALDLYDDGGFYRGLVQFLHNSKCLEVLEFHRITDYGVQMLFATTSHWRAMRRRIETDLGPALRDMHTLKTLILGFPDGTLPAPFGTPSRIQLYLLFLDLMPVSLQNVKLHLSKTSLQLDWKEWGAALKRFPDLRSCKVLVEASVVEELWGGSIATFSARVRSDLPSLETRGVLSFWIEDW